MKSGLDFYKKDTAYRMIRADLEAQYGKEKTQRIWDLAVPELERLWEKYDDVPQEQRMHTHNEIFPRIAIYRALKNELPDSAMEIMDAAVKKAGTKVGNMIGALTRIPGMPKVFVRIMAYMLKKMFGPEAGFTQQYYQTDKNELKFDVTVCPYCKYCELCDCVELTHTFCDSDVYCYGNLPGVLFERTQTLGTGGSCCDFHFKAERRK